MSTTADDAAIRRRWRRNLGVAITLMTLIATASTVMTLASGELTATPVFLWAGAGGVVVARRHVGTPRSAAWVVVGLAVFFAGPLTLA